MQVHQRWGDSDQVRNILVDHPSIASNSDCLIEGSRKDRISHFVLRLLFSYLFYVDIILLMFIEILLIKKERIDVGRYPKLFMFKLSWSLCKGKLKDR